MLCRSAALAVARRHLGSSAVPASRVADLVNARFGDSPETTALVVPSSDTRWTYGELVDRARWFAAGLHEMGYAPGQRLGARLENSEQLLVALLGAALVGADVETAKTAELLSQVSCRGTIVHHEDAQVAGAMIGEHEPIAVGGGALKDPVVHYDILLEAFRGKEAPVVTQQETSYYFSTSRAAREGALVGCGLAASRALATRRREKTCVAVPLAHPMGFGFGFLAAAHVGGTIVLPDVSSRDTETNAQNTVHAMREEKCEWLLADSHVLKALPPDIPRGVESFKGGLTKIGSGDAIGKGTGVTLWGKALTSVGKPPA
jgi:hypothetical protein